MSVLSFDSPLIFDWYTDGAGNKVSITKNNESYQVIDNKIFLTHIPDKYIKINYITIDSTTIYEIIDGGIVNENNFTVDYENGLITVSSIYNGQTAIVNSYGARGSILFPLSRVYDDKNSGNGNAIKTLDQLLVDIETNAMNIVNNLVDSTNHLGEYDPDYTYTKNNEVSYYGSSYIAIQTTINNPPTIGDAINSTYWKLSAKKGDSGTNCASKGVYTSEITYNVTDLVVYLGNIYECIALSVGILPTDTNYFRPFLASTSVSSYKNTYVIAGASTNTVPIGIQVFNKDTDTLYVYKNSTYIEVTGDYTIDSTSENITKTSGAWDGNNATTFNFIVLKNVNKAYYADGRVLEDGTVDESKLSISLTTKLSTYDRVINTYNKIEYGFTDDIINTRFVGTGAKGNGTDDDTAIIQAAIDLASSKHGGTVLLSGSEGDIFLLSQALTIPSDVTLMGKGMNATTLLTNSNTIDAIVIGTDARRVKLCDFVITSPSMGTSNSAIHCDEINGGAEHQYLNLQINTFYYGLKVKELWWNSTVENVRWNGCGYSVYCNSTGGQCLNNLFLRCYSNEPTICGYYINTAKTWTLLECNNGGHQVNTTKYIVFQSVCFAIKIVGCNFENAIITQDSGGIEIWSVSTISIDSCSFASNQVASGGTKAYEIKCLGDSTTEVKNCYTINQDTTMYDFMVQNNARLKLNNNREMTKISHYSTQPILREGNIKYKNTYSGDFTTTNLSIGEIGIDATAGRLYVNDGTTIKYVSLT
jgi:hypothetical protein